jgi:carboxynorspermidine decarboxylase
MSINFNEIPSPCFVLDEKSLNINLQILRHVQQNAGVEIICALKGFAFWHVFPLVAKYLNGATASSLNEALLINEFMNCKAHTYCPVYQGDEFKYLSILSSHLTFNSLSQYNALHCLAKEYNPDISLGLRINPLYSEVKTPLYNPGATDSRLGIKKEQMPAVIPQNIEGLHFHLLCENDSYTLERTLNAVENQFTDVISQVKWLNMGGGHLITKEGYDVEHLVKILQQFKNRYNNLETIILEPGAAVGWQTGFLVATVLDIVPTAHFETAMLDISFACHLPDCLEMPYKPIILGAHEPNDNDKYIYRMGGNSCLAGDYIGMGDYAFEQPLEIGQKIIFDDMIHYTMVKTTFFNGVKHPSIALWTQDNRLQILKDFGYEDYKNRLG